MAIQVGGTTVINNSRVLQNISGLKTIGGTSILGSGNIAVGGGGIRDAGIANNIGMETMGSSSYDRSYVGSFDYRYSRTGTWAGSGDGYFYMAIPGSAYVSERVGTAPNNFTMTYSYDDDQRYMCHVYLGAGRTLSTTQGASQCPHFQGVWIEFDN